VTNHKQAISMHIQNKETMMGMTMMMTQSRKGAEKKNEDVKYICRKQHEMNGQQEGQKKNNYPFEDRVTKSYSGPHITFKQPMCL